MGEGVGMLEGGIGSEQSVEEAQWWNGRGGMAYRVT